MPLEVFGKDPYKTIISTILSSRTKDEVTLERSKELFKIAGNLKQLKNLSEKDIEKIILGKKTFKLKSLAPDTAKKALETFRRKIVN